MHSLFNPEAEADKTIPSLYHPKLEALREVEEYILNVSKNYPFEISYDCTAEEPTNYRTINYTSFAGGMTLHPLRGQAGQHQMHEAYLDGEENSSILKYYEDALQNKTASKYKRQAINNTAPRSDVLVVLAGDNKLAKHTCAGSLLRLHSWYKKVVYKEHPISAKECYTSLYLHLKNEGLKDRIISYSNEYDLYDLVLSAKRVATGFASESALYAVAANKKIICTDLYQNAHLAPFYHINYHLFSQENPRHFISKAFNSYKSGIINPSFQEDWKERVRKYFDYALDLHHRLASMYV